MMKWMWRVAAGVAAGMAGAGWGCSRWGSEYDLIIMSPHQETIQDEFGWAFSDWYEKETGRRPRISWRDQGGGTNAQLEFLRDQYSKHPGGIGVDIFFGGGLPSYLTLKQEGFLESYEIPNLKEVSPDILGTPLYDDGFHYYGAALSSFGLIYNRPMLKALGVEEPKSWEVLGEPKLAGLVAAVDPKSGSAMMAYDVILQAYGWEKGMRVLTLMGANARTFYTSAGDVPGQVAAKQAAVGCAIDFYAANQIDQSGPEVVGFVLPEKLTVVNPDPIGILKGAPHGETARMFVRFVMSKEGQRLWFLPPGTAGGPKKWALHRMPVIPELYKEYAGVAMTKYDPFTFSSPRRVAERDKSFVYNAELGSLRRNVWMDLFGATVMGPQQYLAKAWRAILEVKVNEALVAELVKPPVTEGELTELAGKWGDAGLRSRMTTEWRNAAVKKYQELEAKASKK